MSYKVLNKDNYLVTYIPGLDLDIIKSHNLDIVKLCKVHKDEVKKSIANTSIVISAAVTAYARIHISKLKLNILSSGGQIFYSDTDSIVTDIKLPDSMVDNKKNR